VKGLVRIGPMLSLKRLYVVDIESGIQYKVATIKSILTVVALARRHNKFSCLIRIHLASRFKDGRIACIGCCWKMRWGLVEVDRQGPRLGGVRRNDVGVCCFCRSLIFSCLVQMPLYHGYRSWGVSADSFCRISGKIVY
jgi:hypothetical protein